MVISDACNTETEDGMSVWDVLKGNETSDPTEEMAEDKPSDGDVR